MSNYYYVGPPEQILRENVPLAISFTFTFGKYESKKTA